MSKEVKQNFNQRATAFAAFLTIFAALMILRLFIVSVGQHGYYLALAENQHQFQQKLNPNRGEIFVTDSQSGKLYPIATNQNKGLLFVNPKEVKNPEEAATKLSQFLGLDPKDLLAKFSDTKKGYIAIMHNLNDDQQKVVKDMKLAGIGIDQESQRVYPEGAFLSQVLGFVGYKDNSNSKIGLYGLEKYFEKDLAGTTGSVSTEADLRGNWITGSDRSYVPAQDGTGLVLTIDRSIQFKAEQILKDIVTQHGADAGTILVEDPKTGAILAMANYPTFDPNEYNKVKDPAVFTNMATTKSYEIGSTMKAVTMASGLDAQLISPQTTYQDDGFVEISGYKIQNSEKKGFGQQTMIEVLDKSLNTGAIFVEQKLGNQKFLEYVKKFGFGTPTNIEIPEAQGDLSTLKNSNVDINFYTSSFGQGFTATPIQLLQAYGAMANKGKLVQPFIIRSKIDANGKTIDEQPRVSRQVISENAASLITGMLVDDVENGFGKKAGVKGYYIAGKTGTAQVAVKGSYANNINIGSFAGYGPVEDPKFVMLVRIDRPRDVKFAESTAAPAFGQMAQFILNYYQIPPTRH